MYLRRHKSHVVTDYLILGLILGIGYLTFNKLSGNTEKQLTIGVITATAYAVWGIFHHFHEGDLHWKIMIEYLGLASFGFVALWMLLIVFV